MTTSTRIAAVVTTALLAALAVSPNAWGGQSLPPYEVWIADVSAVTDQAKNYLRGRLPGAERTAIVLDVDNTALENEYGDGLVSGATRPVLEVARLARAEGAAVFFVSNRCESLRPLTEENLARVGYPEDGLYLRPFFDFGSIDRLKTAARAEIERRGYTIVANIGNSDTDLVGGHAERTFKLPDYDGALN